MPLSYNGASIRPAPLVRYNKRYNFNESGQVLSADHVFTLTSTLVGSKNLVTDPAPAQVDADLDIILSQQKELREIFSVQNAVLEIKSPNTVTETLRATCKVESIEFSESVWVDRCDYTIVLSAKNIEGEEEAIDNLRSKREEWNIEEQLNGVYAITHVVEAVGEVLPGESGQQALYRAKQYCVDNKISIAGAAGNLTHAGGNNILSGVISSLSSHLSGYWNYSLIESPGITDSSWRITETFVHFSGGNHREEWSLTYNEATEGQSTANIEGTIEGYSTSIKDNNEKLTRAKAGWVTIQPLLFTRVNNDKPSSATVNPNPITKQTVYDTLNGFVRYNYTYGFSTNGVVSGAIEESISVVDNGHSDIFAEIQIPGRQVGPLIQNLNTVTAPTRSVAIDLLYPVSSSGTLRSRYLSKPNTNSLIDALKPESGYYYISQNSETWNPLTGRYNRVMAWVMPTDGLILQGIPSGINNPE